MLRRTTTSLAALSLALWILGCSGAKQPPAEQTGNAPPGAESHAEENDHAHAAEGPHGGHLIELGDGKHQAELLHDEASHTVTVHLLDAAGKNPVRIAEKTVILQLFRDGKFIDYTLAAAGDADAEGASQFTLADEQLVDALSHAENLRGRLRVTIDGQEQMGVIEHSPHEHAGHDHAEHDDDHDHAEHDHEHK